jgi:hypothetical protein
LRPAGASRRLRVDEGRGEQHLARPAARIRPIRTETVPVAAPEGHLPLLLRLEARRLSDALRSPRAGTWIAVLLPAALVVGGLWAAGEAARPDVSTGDGRILLGLIVSAPVAFQAYPVLFRPDDDAFLRRLGIPPRAGFQLRALRLLVLMLLVVLLLMIPFAATGAEIATPLGIALGAGVAAWAVSLWSLPRAAERTVDPKFRPGFLATTMAFDRELVAAGPLVFAPLLPVAAGAAASIVLGAEAGVMAVRPLLVIALSIPFVLLGMRAFERGMPRFAPHVGELAYAPPPDAGDSALVIGRGLAALLPRRAQAVRARDAVVVDRRFRWAGRLAFPVAAFSVLALLRAGDDAAVRGWVAVACALALLLQGGAVIAVGRMERGRLRWIDRAHGLSVIDRMIGRWAAALGLALWLVVPVSLVWSFTVPTSPAWWWLAAAGGGAALASAASVAAGGR